MNITDTLTICAWVKPTVLYPGVTNTSIMSMGFHYTNNEGFSFIVNPDSGGRILYYIGNRTSRVGDYSSSDTISVDQWYYAVLTYDNPTLKLYLNGEEDTAGSNTLTGPIAYDKTDSPYNALCMGAESGGGSSFHGYIDEIAIFNRALSPEEIKQRYRAGKP